MSDRVAFFGYADEHTARSVSANTTEETFVADIVVWRLDGTLAAAPVAYVVLPQKIFDQFFEARVTH